VFTLVSVGTFMTTVDASIVYIGLPAIARSFCFEELRGFDPLLSGMLLTPYSLALAAVAPFSGRLADRFGSRLLAPLGLSLAAAGLFLLAQIDTRSGGGVAPVSPRAWVGAAPANPAGLDVSQPATESARPGAESARPGAESARPGAEPARPGPARRTPSATSPSS
jgi:MFS family permease